MNLHQYEVQPKDSGFQAVMFWPPVNSAPASYPRALDAEGYWAETRGPLFQNKSVFATHAEAFAAIEKARVINGEISRSEARCDGVSYGDNPEQSAVAQT